MSGASGAGTRGSGAGAGGARPAYLHGASDEPLLGETIGENLRRTAAQRPEAEALIVRHQGIRWSWAEFDGEVDRAARALIAAGLERGDRLGLWSPNRAEWTVLQYATARAGVILVNLNPAYRDEELRYALRHSGCRMLVAARAFRGTSYEETIERVAPGLPALERVVLLDTPGWEELLAGAQQVSHAQLADREAQLSADDAVNVQYTSGTTGAPKGATLSHHNILNNGRFVGRGLNLGPEDRLCIPVPFYHCFGMVMGNLACTAHGATMVVPGEAFDAGATLAAVAQERCTALHGVPTMFIAMLDHPEFETFDLSSLRTGIMAGSPCPVETMRAVLDRMHMAEVTIAYGMTETSPVSTQTRASDELERRVGTVGTVHPHVELKVVDAETGRTVARGETGELCTRGYGVMLGYWDDPERTREAVDAAGWMHTGDLGAIDDAGYVTIEGRIKDMVIRGGENVYPREVEEFVHTLPGVADVQVIGVPDPRYGEELMAWVRLRRGAETDAEALREACRGRIAHFKIPRYWRVVEEYPMTVTGKVQKFRMREQAVEELGLR